TPRPEPNPAPAPPAPGRARMQPQATSDNATCQLLIGFVPPLLTANHRRPGECPVRASLLTTWSVASSSHHLSTALPTSTRTNCPGRFNGCSARVLTRSER